MPNRVAVVQLRAASPSDAVTIAALAIQVFLDTYATDGIRPDLAREAFLEYSAEAFAQRLGQANRRFILAESESNTGPASGLLGFAEISLSTQPAPAGNSTGAELIRLYIQPAAQHRGIGRALLQHAEQMAIRSNIPAIWLTAWDGNHNARAFYAHLGYVDVGPTTYLLQGRNYGNRVFAKSLAQASRI